MTRMHTLASLTVACMVLACGTTPPQAQSAPPIEISLTGSGAAAAVAELLQTDLAGRSDRLHMDSASPELSLELVPVEAAADITHDGYRLRGTDGAYSVEATTALGWQYGAYELLERAGLLFLHPTQTHVPRSLTDPGTLDEAFAPHYRMRGTHMHTLHPIEYESTLLGASDDTLERFAQLLGWLIARRQNYLEWNLLRTVDSERWLEHATQMVEIAHARGFQMSIVAPFAFRQQNSFTLVSPESTAPATEQIADSVDWLMQAGWDFVNVEMGASEFFPISDVEQVEYLSFLARYLDETYGARTATKVHISSGQTAPSYGDINFNFVAQFADPRMGVMPHSVQFYDLYRPAPTYDQVDFSAMRAFLLSQVGTRPVYYYPETAYWVTFDNDVPLYLPQYIYARWNDLYRLRDSGMDGVINFSSGFEWGYWMHDFAAAWYAADPAADYRVALRRMLAPLGDAASGAVDLLDELVQWQGDALLIDNGIRWLVAWDAADEIGHTVDIHAQPYAARFYEIAEMDAAALAATQAEVAGIQPLADRLFDFAGRWQALTPDSEPVAQAIHREIADGIEVTAWRAQFMAHLYAAAIARRQYELGSNDDGEAQAARLLQAAADDMTAAQQVVRAREKDYRFPYDEIAVDRPSLTSYPFGYLRTVSDLWYWQRDLEHATDPKGYNIVEALYDLVESGGF